MQECSHGAGPQVDAVLSERRIAMCRWVFLWCEALVFPALVYFLVVDAVDHLLDPGSSSDSEQKLLDFLRHSMLPGCVFVLVLSFFHAFPRLVTHFTLRCFFVAWTALGAQALLAESPECAVFNILVRFGLSVAMADTVFVSIVHTACGVLFPVLPFLDDGASFSAWAFFAGSAALICIVSMVIETILRSQIATALELRVVKNYSEAIEQLLSGMCDALVVLTNTMQIAEPSPKLAGLLLQSGNMQGITFCDLLLDGEEQGIFARFMQQPTESFAQVATTRLRDLSSRPVTVQMFHVQFLNWDGNIMHALGIRDIGEERVSFLQGGASPVGLGNSVNPVGRGSLPISAQPSAVGGASLNGATVNSTKQVQSNDAPPVENYEEYEDDSSTSERLPSHRHSRSLSQRTPTIEEDSEWSAAPESVPLDLEASHSEIAVWVACDNKFTIVKCTARFADITGPAATNGGAKFLDYVYLQDQLAVTCRLQQEVSEFWCKQDVGPEDPPVFLPFRMWTKGTVMLHVEAQVMVEVPDQGEDEDNELIVVRFVTWREKGKRKKFRRKRVLMKPRGTARGEPLLRGAVSSMGRIAL
eukprot:CAMPEP_0178441710 /NCGR_PEP_ID=MMETSP0689_2-20121128/37659_1 /TAXON_ID=160604 /ORGANISM="Amphidinium massartii, Strain CS-259" /LENGTH=585 /DNA_ID=CAMNT_0020064973 /DNA_START=131 /DNA_END=1888 /DNA_ORIENTATION=+